MQEIRFEQNIEQELQLVLSPKLLQMLKILNLSYIELIGEIEKASEENPFIEIERHEKLIEYLHCLGQDKKMRKEVDYREYPGLESMKETKKTLREFLLEQLGYQELQEKDRRIAEILIDEVDGNGYLANYEEIKKNIMGKNGTSPSSIDSALRIIQTFEPEGVGARDAKECLLIQIREFGFDNKTLEKLVEKVVKNHLEDLGKKEYKKIAMALNISEEAVSEISNFIKSNLNPLPAASFGEASKEVIPSFSISPSEEGFKLVNIEEEYGPKIMLSKEYQRMLKDPKTDAKTVKFLKEKFEKAKEMLENIDKRGKTSESIMKIVMERQSDFFKNGSEWIMPLEQKEIANILGLHPSTISRAVSSKYVQTPKGLLPLKFLCQREFSGFSKAAIKARILELVSNEGNVYPLKDEDIVDMLCKQGVGINRRTVASYRRQLGIMPFKERGKS